MADEKLIQRIVKAVRDDADGMSITELAQALGISRPTAAKYVEIGEARKLLESVYIASGRYVTIRGGIVRRRSGAD